MLLTGSRSKADQEQGVPGSIVSSALDYFTLEVILSLPLSFVGKFTAFSCVLV